MNDATPPPGDAPTAAGTSAPFRAGPEEPSRALPDASSRALPACGDPPPFFAAHVFVCCNTRPEGHRRGSCARRGAERLRDYMKARAKELGLRGVRVNSAGCLDRCEFGPVVVIYPEGVWYRAETRDDVDEILRAHLGEGGRATRLMLTERDVAPKD